jgi:oligo-1,6-glucosidase
VLKKQHWHSATVYQVYPRSFSDSNGDGLGDIPGIVSKLDYLAELGIELIWLSPVCQSPMADNGYDISDYQAIAPEFGTLEQFDTLIAEAKARNIGILLDLVVNHSSIEHDWFVEARKSRHNPKRDYYIWRNPAPDGGVPTATKSLFGGPAWTLDPLTGQYYLHLFAKEQPDLNWANPEVRQAVYAMMNWWMDRGIAGFRMDVIDLIAKDIDAGITADGPKLHTYLREMHSAVFERREAVTVGEAWSATPESAKLYSGQDRHELSMIFQFENVTQRWDPEHGKWKPKPFDLVALKRVINKWQLALADDGWNSLFWGNHDLPRAVSTYGDPGQFRVRSAQMLATVMNLLKGTPYIYQGEEIGMTNIKLSDIADYRDIETLNLYALHIAAGFPPEDFLVGANANGRDNARTPMQWDDTVNAGFTTGTPWLVVNPNYTEINAAADRASKDSIFAHYKRLIELRKAHPVIVYGRFAPVLEDHGQVFAYARELDGQRLSVVANFSAETVMFDVPAELEGRGTSLIANIAPVTSLAGWHTLAPYEAFAILSDVGR